MWKEKLPRNCPPENSNELDIEAYRILKEEVPKKSDFLPYVHLYPENERYKTLCEAYAISSFDTKQHAIDAWKRALARGKRIGDFIARIQISPTDGQNKFSAKTGHISTWLYADRSYEDFECTNIGVINEN